MQRNVVITNNDVNYLGKLAGKTSGRKNKQPQTNCLKSKKRRGQSPVRK
jgi:hypothetical protein